MAVVADQPPAEREGGGVGGAASEARVAILTYHGISAWATRSFARWTVDPLLFDEQLAALRESGHEVIPFGDVPEALAAGRTGVSISIDDGLADAAENAVPALQRHGLPATLFVPSGFVGGRARWLAGRDGEQAMLSWDAITDLTQAGFEIGSHGHMHLAADVNAVELVEHDAHTSKMLLEDRLGQEARSFAYPFGYHGGPARSAVKAAGFAQACAAGDLPAFPTDDRWTLPRLEVPRGTTPEALLAMVGWEPTRAARGLAHVKHQLCRAGRRVTGWGPLAGHLQGALP